MRTLLVIGIAGGCLAASALHAEARGGRGGIFRLRGPIATESRPTNVSDRPRTETAARVALGFGAGFPIVGAAEGRIPGPAASDRAAMPVEAARAGPSEAESRHAAEASSAPRASGKVADAAPWCRPERLAGSGVGFCLIN
jgi:hypothetical protein